MSDKETTEEIGIPSQLRVKRKYTMSESALRQRREAAKQPKPGLKGVRNNYKHGLYAKNFANKIKPCKSTCQHYPCELVSEGHTKPGGDCLDKVELLQTFRAIHEAIRNKQLEGFQEIASLQIASNLRIIEMLQEDILRDGTIVRRETPTREGLKVDYVPHPSLQVLPKLIADLGITPAEMLITPRAAKKADADEEGAKTLAEMMAGIGRNLQRGSDQEQD
ncbi:MAG: hypothetical protein Tsb0017_27790 [Geothermobacteraceae bacterium]